MLPDSAVTRGDTKGIKRSVGRCLAECQEFGPFARIPSSVKGRSIVSSMTR